MPLTITYNSTNILGNKLQTRGTLSFDNSYPTGGEAFTARQLGLAVVETLHIQPEKGVVFEGDISTMKVKAYVPGLTVGAAGAITNDDFPVAVGVPPGASAFSISLSAGETTHRFGAMPEVASTGDLSAITAVQWQATGV